MYRFFVTPDQITETEIRITGQDVNHIKNVLRMKPGEEIRISDSEGTEYFCGVDELGADYVTAKIRFVEVSGQELPAKIWLFQGLPKVDRMELIIQKSVELGVYGIVPVAAKRCVMKVEPKKEEAKLKRWNAISESAAKQSKRGIIPEVHPVMTMKQALEFAGSLDMIIMPYECEDGIAYTREVFGKIRPGMQVGVFIGPEGGLDEKEVEMAREQGAHIVTLGKRILRTETAAMAVMSILMYQLEGQEA